PATRSRYSMPWVGNAWSWKWTYRRDFIHAAACSIPPPDFASGVSGQKVKITCGRWLFPRPSRRSAPYHPDTRKNTALGGFAFTHPIRKTAAPSSRWKGRLGGASNGAEQVARRFPAAGGGPADVAAPCAPWSRVHLRWPRPRRGRATAGCSRGSCASAPDAAAAPALTGTLLRAPEPPPARWTNVRAH